MESSLDLWSNFYRTLKNRRKEYIMKIGRTKKTKLSKRLDLQGIRALAIIVVLGFHFFPEYFPNGYLGVDQ
uniref:Acyl_transf_3 domain-containing protein n=1 Tax=Caenorhabditis tropicalis TaxID=1561998 RepID=A0A1I7U2X6_9PELO